MKWTKILAIIGTVLIVVALSSKLVGLGCKDKAEAVEPSQFEERINWDNEPDYLSLNVICCMWGCDRTCNVCDPDNPKWAKEPNEPEIDK